MKTRPNPSVSLFTVSFKHDRYLSSEFSSGALAPSSGHHCERSVERMPPIT